MFHVDRLFEPRSLALMIPIFVGIVWIVMAALKHRERMALIEKGIHPDSVEERAAKD